MLFYVKKGFTLIELMIVLSIISILAVGLYPAITGYLARGRDSVKVTEIKQLNTAIVLYQVANRSYRIPGAAYQGGGLWQDKGWINYVNGVPGSYPKALFTALQEKGFINKGFTNIITSNLNSPATPNTLPCVNTTGVPVSQNLYMYYFDDATGKYSISGYLEKAKAVDLANIQLSHNGTGASGTCGHYGRNYAVGIN